MNASIENQYYYYYKSVYLNAYRLFDYVNDKLNVIHYIPINCKLRSLFTSMYIMKQVYGEVD